MGAGSYDVMASVSRSKSMDYASKSVNETFKARRIQLELDPNDVKIREARDSKEHPESIPVIIALDVTGSMGSIPHEMITKGLTGIMRKLQEENVDHVQVMFMAIGDHECDSAPLQVSQFESDDQLLDKWLSKIYVESGGGGNDGESYLLAWYFAANHTSIDCFEKRNKKGYLFTIGDEPNLTHIPATAIKGIMGSGQKSYTDDDLLEEVRSAYNVFHIHVTHGYGAIGREEAYEQWKQKLGNNMLICKGSDDVAKTIADAIVVVEKKQPESFKVDETLSDEPTIL